MVRSSPSFYGFELLVLAGMLGAVHTDSGQWELSPSVIATAFGLAVPTGPLVAVESGPSARHHLWRLSTTQGRFAVKAVGHHQQLSANDLALRGPMRLELAALAAGVPMPRPCLVSGSGTSVAAVSTPGRQPLLVGVHEWVDGTTATAPCSTELAAELGGALAVIHRVGFDCGEAVEIDPWYRTAHGPAHWSGLADRAEQAGLGWAAGLRAALPVLAEVEALAAARAAETVPLVVTHSDLVPGNVLVSAQGRPWIVDWDDAGPWNTAEEVAAAVVSWSTGPQGEPAAPAALALIEGYRRAGGTFNVGSPTVLAGSLSAAANWLELTVRRGLSHAADASGRVQADTEVAEALGQLGWRWARLDRWTDLLR
jgi:Ser/Thr protein kinase RdoA (MazF antagonist)